MSISIWYKNGAYHWELYDGPDGIDHFIGTAINLGDAFEQILISCITNRVISQLKNRMDY
jgi:hypothetical protein